MSVTNLLLGIVSQARNCGRGWRRRVDERLQTVERRLDALNRRLAKQSVPEERRFSVGRLTLERKASAARRRRTQPGRK